MQACIFTTAVAAMTFVLPALAQQSRWASSSDPTARFIIEGERKWNESICVNNGIVAGLLADDFQGTSTSGARFTKADELRDEKGPHSARNCGLDEAKVRFFSDSLAIVYGREHSTGKDSAHPAAKFCQIWTDTWLTRDGRWQIIASQDNQVPCK
jgi:hypothetical protein